jgi:hypothetical protein
MDVRRSLYAASQTLRRAGGASEILSCRRGQLARQVWTADLTDVWIDEGWLYRVSRLQGRQ